MASTVGVSPLPARRAARSHSARLGPRLGRALLYLIVIVVGIILMVPFFWAIDSSLKPVEEIRLLPPEILPSKIMWSNYPQVFRTKQFPFWVQNTFFVAILASAGTIVTAALAGYSFARFRFPGRSLLFGLTLSTMLLPETVTLIPSYILYYYLGWLDTFYPLIVPFWFGGGAFYIFLFRQFFMSLPTDLDEAAKIDGASYLQVLLLIILPLSIPVLLTVAIITFISHYNSFLFPLLVLTTPEKFTLSIGIRSFSISPTQDAAPLDHILLAMSVMMTLPILLMFFLGQRYYVRGVVMSGIKG
ncbi:MAG TPA: carbohydrate ABC transporter permease [Chloroflexota bacterium]|jgi:ABC-type glycerol-3-phosphate transport system permease component|nr:carbohydrate ABC transporter permease [Chloroflexota bacterium]